MAQYIQTVLVPLPKQRLSDKDWYKGQHQGRKHDNRRNQEINSILAFFK